MNSQERGFWMSSEQSLADLSDQVADLRSRFAELQARHAQTEEALKKVIVQLQSMNSATSTLPVYGPSRLVQEGIGVQILMQEREANARFARLGDEVALGISTQNGGSLEEYEWDTEEIEW
jgi:uncharacterized protein YlxW (UPF0749 family)